MLLQRLNEVTQDPATGNLIPLTDEYFYRDYIERYNAYFLVQASAVALGMNGDELLGCLGRNVMSMGASFVDDNTTWSECSRKALEDTVGAKGGRDDCLGNKDGNKKKKVGWLCHLQQFGTALINKGCLKWLNNKSTLDIFIRLKITF